MLPSTIFSFLNLISHACAAKIFIRLEDVSESRSIKKDSSGGYIFVAGLVDFSIKSNN